MGQRFHLYVHWPWCLQKCPYCDFNSHGLNGKPLEDSTREAYVAQLLHELTLWQRNQPHLDTVASIFFGGGTPSLMHSAHIARVLNQVDDLWGISRDTEVTLECNPASLHERHTRSVMQEWRDAGINRVSIGLQGLQDDWLKFLGRSHTVRDAFHTLDDAQAMFNRVNADVIYGLPHQSLEDWSQQLDILAQRGLSHIAAYQLTVERQTAFWGQVRRGVWQPVNSDTEADFFDLTRSALTTQGYENYEISNFARPGEACRHNQGVWRGECYVGIGAGAHGRVVDGQARWFASAHRKHPDGYMKQISDLQTHLAVWEPLDSSRCVQERLFSGLRLAEGVDIGLLEKTFGSAVVQSAIDWDELPILQAAGWVETHASTHTRSLRLTREGWARLDGILKRLLRTERPQLRVQIENSETDATYT